MKPKVYPIEGPWPGRLALVARPRGNDWLLDEIKGFAESGIDIVVSLLNDDENHELGLSEEASLAAQHGLRFVSFPIADYGVPVSVEAFSRVVADVEAWLGLGKSIAIHCRQSIGRSSLLAASVLSINNDNVDDCFQQISKARGTNVPDTAEQRKWVNTFAQTFRTHVIG